MSFRSHSYQNHEIALNSGMILRECIRHEPLAKILLYHKNFWNCFDYIEMPTFDVASDAFATFRVRFLVRIHNSANQMISLLILRFNIQDLLTKHKAMVAEFLEKRFDDFFSRYTTLLNSNNYVTKRQSLKLLGELLLDRTNFNVMTKYIANSDNLKLMMNMLRDKSRNIQFEAFHVFKVCLCVSPFRCIFSHRCLANTRNPALLGFCRKSNKT